MLMGCGQREDSFENVSPGGLSTLSSHIAPLEGFQYERKAWFLITAKQLRINVSDLSGASVSVSIAFLVSWLS